MAGEANIPAATAANGKNLLDGVFAFVPVRPSILAFPPGSAVSSQTINPSYILFSIPPGGIQVICHSISRMLPPPL